MTYEIRMMREDMSGKKTFADDVITANSMSEACCAAVKGRKTEGGWTCVAWKELPEGERPAADRV